MKINGIFTLDAGTTSAFAYGYPGDTPVWRHRRLEGVEPGGDAGIFHAFAVWLERQLGEFSPAYFVYEPMFVHPERISAAGRLLGMQGIACGIAYRLGLKIREYPIKSVAQFHGTAGLRSAAKKRATRENMIQRYGFAGVTEDEADALALWLYAEAILEPRSQRCVGPLFSPRREVVDSR